MKLALITLFCFFSTTCFGFVETLESPNKSLILRVDLTKSGQIWYSLDFKKKPVVTRSTLGFEFTNNDDFNSGFEKEMSSRFSENSSWEPVLGEVKTIQNHYNELLMEFKQTKTGRKYQFVLSYIMMDLVLDMSFQNKKN